MDRQYVESSMIASIGYDPMTNLLEVEFKSNGAIWNYSDVPENIWYDFLYAESKGKYFHHNIRGQYPENRVG